MCQERWFRVKGSWVFEERSGKADRLELRRDSAISEQAQMALAAPSLSSQLGLPKEFADMEQKLQEMHTKEDDSLFYYHSSEDRIVLSHAMFWTMTLSSSKVR